MKIISFSTRALAALSAMVLAPLTQAATESVNSISNTAASATAMPEHSILIGTLVLLGGLIWSARSGFVAAWKMSAPALKE